MYCFENDAMTHGITYLLDVEAMGYVIHLDYEELEECEFVTFNDYDNFMRLC